MEEYLNGTGSELLSKITEAQMLAKKMSEENDQAVRWASAEISKYKQLLAYSLNSLIGHSIYYATPTWRKIECHMIKEVKIDRQTSGFFGEEYNGEVVVKIYVDNGDGYFIAEKLGETVFLRKEDAEMVAGSADKRK